MKKLLLSLALIAGMGMANNLKAQEGGFEGRWFLGGALGYYHTGENSVSAAGKQDVFSIKPIIGYFITPTIAIGGQIGYEYSQEKTYIGKNKTNSIVIAPLARKYWGINDKLYVFGELSVPIGFGNEKPALGEKTNYIDIGVYLKPGLDFYLSKHWSIETTIGQFGYGNHNPDEMKHTDKSAFGFDLTNVTFGAKYVF